MLSEKQAKDYQFYLDNKSSDWAEQFLAGQQIDYMITTLNKAKIYYQVNPDLRNKSKTFNLYAKLSLPKKVLNTSKALSVGVYCGPGTQWTDSLKIKARNMLLSVAFSKWSAIL